MRRDGFYPGKKLADRRARYFALLNVWPLLGLEMVLLVFFMTVTGPPYSCTRRFLPDLAAAKHVAPLPRANRDDAMHLYVLRDGSYYFGNNKVSLEEIASEIRESLRNGAEKRIYLQADRRAKYYDVKRALEQVSEGGVENVAIVAKRAEE
jgi:biopolymer transport protein ExbD